MSRTKVQGQLYSDAGVEKYARLWCENLLNIYGPKMAHEADIVLVEVWMDLPFKQEDWIAVVVEILANEELRTMVHAFDVLYLSERIVEWDSETKERFSYRYSLERDLMHSSVRVQHGLNAIGGWDAREDKKYG